MTADTMLTKLVRARAPVILVLHKERAWHDYVDAAAHELTVAGRRVVVLHAQSTKEVRGVLGADAAALIGCFVQTGTGAQAFQWIDTLKELAPTLLASVALVRPEQPVPRVCLEDPSGFYLYITTREDDSGPESIVNQCRSYMLWMLDRYRSLAAIADGADQFAKAPGVELLRGLTQMVLTRACQNFQVDARLVEDLESDDAETQLIVRTSQSQLVDGTYEAMLAEHLRMRRLEQKREDLAISQLFGEEVVADVASATVVPVVEGFKRVSLDGHAHWLRLAHWREGARASGLAIVPRLDERRSERLVLACFQYVFSVWVAAQERLLGEPGGRGKAAAKAQDAGALSQLVAGVAHEINTPLGVIITGSDIIREATGRLSLVADPQVRELEEDLVSACEMIQKNADRLAALVKKFRNTSSVQTTEPLVSCELGEVVESAIDLHRTSLNGGPPLSVNTILDLDPGAEQWRGYPQQLTQVIVHLLANIEQHAYRRKGGMAELRVRGQVAGGVRTFSLALSDYGAGIAPEHLPRIFDAFYTTDRTNRSTGLGLAVVYNIVTESLKGTVSCESREGAGSTFIIEFGDIPAEA